MFQKGYISLCKRLHIHAICLRTHIIKHMIISVICTNMRKSNKFFLKSPRPSLPLKRAPPLTPTLSPSGEREETALLGARNRYALRLADHQRSRQIVRDGTAGVLVGIRVLFPVLLLLVLLSLLSVLLPLLILLPLLL